MFISKLISFLQSRLEKIEQYIVYIAIFGFAGHILLIFISSYFGIFPEIRPLVGSNYLFAITTPLNIILFYEILALVLALPKSIFIGVMKQFEIVTLILVRQVFKVIAESNDITTSFKNIDFQINIALFFVGSIIAFLLAAYFKNLSYEFASKKVDQVGRLFAFKSMVTLFVLVLLFSFAAYDLFTSIGVIWGINNIDFDYIYSLFYVLIFVDVLIFLTALYYTDDFGIVFIDSAFILAGIFLRFSIAFDGIYKVGTILASMLGIIVILLIYKYVWEKGRLLDLR